MILELAPLLRHYLLLKLMILSIFLAQHTFLRRELLIQLLMRIYIRSQRKEMIHLNFHDSNITTLSPFLAQ